MKIDIIFSYNNTMCSKTTMHMLILSLVLLGAVHVTPKSFLVETVDTASAYGNDYNQRDYNPNGYYSQQVMDLASKFGLGSDYSATPEFDPAYFNRIDLASDNSDVEESESEKLAL